MKKFDFSGYATKNNVRCSDGRTIKPNAFANDDGKKVPLVWQHSHNDPSNILGHAVLENREDGVYAYAAFNDTQKGRDVKEIVAHGDIRALSIYANQLKQVGGDVVHGAIKEVSLVISGANPKAGIDNVVIHDEFGNITEELYDEAIIHSDEEFEVYHDDDDEDYDGDVEYDDEEDYSSYNDDEDLEYEDDDDDDLEYEDDDDHEYYDYDDDDDYDDDEDIEHSDSYDYELYHDDDDDDDDDEETVADVFDSIDEDDKEVVYALIGAMQKDPKLQKMDEDFKDLVRDTLDDLSEEQQQVVAYLVGESLNKKA